MNEQKKYEIPKWVIPTAFIAIIGGVWWAAKKETTGEDVYYFVYGIANYPSLWICSIITWEGTAIIHASCKSIEKARVESVKYPYFDIKSWTISIFLAASLCVVLNSTLDIISEIIGEMVGVKDFLIKTDKKFRLVSLLVSSLLLIGYCAFRYGIFIADIYRIVKNKE